MNRGEGYKDARAGSVFLLWWHPPSARAPPPRRLHGPLVHVYVCVYVYLRECAVVSVCVLVCGYLERGCLNTPYINTDTDVSKIFLTFPDAVPFAAYII